MNLPNRIRSLFLMVAALAVCMAPASRSQNVDDWPTINGADVVPGSDKLLLRDASVPAASGALRRMAIADLVNVPGLFSTVGKALTTLPTPGDGNPRYLRINGNGTVSELDWIDFKTALGLEHVVNTNDWAKLNAIKLFPPEQFGAVGNGVDNDVVPVQSAINAAKVAGGTMLPTRWYGIGAPGLVIDKGWVRIEGFSHGGWFEDGEARCGFKPLTSSMTVLTLRAPGPDKTSRGIVLKNFSIVGDQSTVMSATSTGIRSVYVDGAPTDCMLIDGVNVQWMPTGIYLEGDDTPTITNSRFCDGRYAIWGKNLANGNISTCCIYDNRGYGVKVEGGYGLVIDGNMFGRDTWSIWAVEFQSLSITGNHFTRDNAVPVSTDGAIWLFYGQAASRTIISGNNFVQKTGQNLAFDWDVGVIKVDHTNNVNIASNSIDYGDTQKPAVSVIESDNINIDANQFSRNTAFPVTLDSLSTRVQIGMGNQHHGIITIPNQAVLQAPSADGIPVYADNAAAITAGRRLDQIFRTTAGEMRVVVEEPTAKAYLDAVAATGKTVTRAQRQFASKWIADDKAAGTWTLNKRGYLRGWGTAAANAIDVMTGTTLGTWQPNTAAFTFSNGYTAANGTTGYFDTGTNAAGYGLTNNDAGHTVLIYNGGSAGYGTIVGQGTSGNRAFSMLKDESGNIELYGWAGGHVDMPGPVGIFVGTMTGTVDRSRTYKFTNGGGHVVGADNNASVGVMTTENFEVWRRGTDTLHGNAQIGADFIHTNKTQAQAQGSSERLKTVWEGLFGLTLP